MSMVIALREDEGGLFIGFIEDNELLECSVCNEDAAYRLRYTSDQEGNIEEHRFNALRLIGDEHPNHSGEIRIV